MTNKTILLQAAPFCYGPISTTLNVAQALAQFNHHLIMIDEGPTGELIRRSGLPVESIAASTWVPFSCELEAIIDQADLVLSNTDPVFAAACLNRGARVVVLDTLFWMWDRIDPSLLNCELYIVQDFYGVDEQAQRLGKPSNFMQVGPLVRSQKAPIPQAQRENLILVSLGGCDCTLVDPEKDLYPTMILELVEGILRSSDCEVILTVGERAACALEPRDERIQVQTLSNQDHLDVMRRVRAILLSPGLTGTMEVLEAETPVFFLPPQNYSQVLQLAAYRNANVAPYGLAWSDVYPEFDLPPYLPEEEAVKRARGIIDRFVRDPAAREAFRQRLRSFLQQGVEHYDPAPGRRFRESFGMDGPEQAARAINNLLVGH